MISVMSIHPMTLMTFFYIQHSRARSGHHDNIIIHCFGFCFCLFCLFCLYCLFCLFWAVNFNSEKKGGDKEMTVCSSRFDGEMYYHWQAVLSGSRRIKVSIMIDGRQTTSIIASLSTGSLDHILGIPVDACGRGGQGNPCFHSPCPRKA